MRITADTCITHVAEWMVLQGRSLTARFHEAERFLQALDPARTHFSFRTFSDTPYTRRPGWDPLERALHGELAECWDELIELNQQGAATSVTINHTNGQGRAVTDIESVRALFLDDDNPPQSWDRFPLQPQIQVQTSPHHYHHYWLVQNLEPSRFSEMQSRLARLYGGDNKVMALNQSMQLPGLWRRKNLNRPLLPYIRRINSIEPYQTTALEELIAVVCD